MIHRIDGIPQFFAHNADYFGKKCTSLVTAFMKGKELPVTFTVNVGLSGGKQNDKDFIAFGVVECMNQQLNYNVELKRSGVCYVIKECCDE